MQCSNLACGSPAVVIRAFNPEFSREEWYCRVCWESQVSFKQLSVSDIKEVIMVEQCVYHEECKGEGKHQCPRCKRWYCDECHEMFLPIDARFPAPTATICPQYHYDTSWRPKLEGENR